jgi:putative zinc finger protein
VNCLTVRERLPEYALGALSGQDAAAVERHLEWCAACRKEAGELQRAAATLAYSVAPVEPPAGLEERVVGAVQDAAGRRRAAAPRRSRVAAAGVLAAMLALSGLGWGAVMAGRAERAEERAAAAADKQQKAIANFQELIQDLEGADPANIVEVATLMSPRQRAGDGDALVLLSPSSDDLALVLVNGLGGVRAGRFPLEVRLLSDRAGELVVGHIQALDSGGSGAVRKWFVGDLTAYSAVVVRDADGKVLLNGGLSVQEPAS